jgi:hemerythrin-like metal-binding protein
MEEEVKKIEWKPEYDLGIQVIDENHRKFVALVNRFVDSLNDQSCLNDPTGIFYGLIHYAEHFMIREEILFKDLGYENFSKYKKWHEGFINKIKYFQGKYAHEDPEICMEMYTFLTDWFKDHILQFDQETARFLKQKGLS